jgi:hypothetical protein
MGRQASNDLSAIGVEAFRLTVEHQKGLVGRLARYRRNRDLFTKVLEDLLSDLRRKIVSLSDQPN